MIFLIVAINDMTAAIEWKDELNANTTIIAYDSSIVKLDSTTFLSGNPEAEIKGVFQKYIQAKVSATQGAADKIVCKNSGDDQSGLKKNAYRGWKDSFWCWNKKGEPDCSRVNEICEFKVYGNKKAKQTLPCWVNYPQRAQGCPDPCGCLIRKNEVTKSTFQTGTLAADAGKLNEVLGSWGVSDSFKQEYQKNLVFDKADWLTFSFVLEGSGGQFDTMVGSIRNQNNELAIGYFAATAVIDKMKGKYSSKDSFEENWYDTYPPMVGWSREKIKELKFSPEDIKNINLGLQNVAFRSLLDKM